MFMKIILKYENEEDVDRAIASAIESIKTDISKYGNILVLVADEELDKFILIGGDSTSNNLEADAIVEAINNIK